jgi:hypothetical protein
VMRCHPASSWIRWPSPIAFMPSVAPTHGIPVTLDPYKLRAWS